MCEDCGNNDCGCESIIVQQGQKGNTGNDGQQGTQGFNGWSPLLGLIQNDGTATGTGTRFAMQFTNWTGGTGSSPSNPTSPNIYMQADGTFGALSSAVNLMGPQGFYEVWLGEFASAPSTPPYLGAYRDTSLKQVRIWDGSNWQKETEDGLSGGSGTPGVSITFLGDVSALPGSPTLNQVARLTTVTPITAYLWNGTAWVIAWKDGVAGTNGTNGVNGFNYETVDGNGIPAVASKINQILRRKQDNTGYEFAEQSQITSITNLINKTWP